MLFEQINSEFTRSCRNISCHDANRGHQKSRFESNHEIGSFSCEHLRSNHPTSQAPFNKQNLACEPLYEEDEVLYMYMRYIIIVIILARVQSVKPIDTYVIHVVMNYIKPIYKYFVYRYICVN